MITFDQMEANIAALGCECPLHQLQPMTHAGITEPIVDQLVDYCARDETVLFTPFEMIKLVALVRSQSMALDALNGDDEDEPSNDLTVAPSRGRRIAAWLALALMIVGVIDVVRTAIHFL